MITIKPCCRRETERCRCKFRCIGLYSLVLDITYCRPNSYEESHFIYTNSHLLFRLKFRAVPFAVYRLIMSADSEDPRLISHEIIFEVGLIQPM